MKLHYHKDFRGNFGDDLNVPFFNCVCPGYEEIGYDKLIGIGTLINDSLGTVQNSLIFGSGYGQGKPPSIDFASTRILGVRGPRTAKALNINPERYVIGDPAIYLPYIEELNSGKPAAKDCTVIALHHRTAELWSFPDHEVDGIFFLDPAALPVVDYIATIKSARYIFAEAMHGAIVASAYGIPFVRTKILGKTNHEKWMDLFESLDLDANPVFELDLELSSPPIARVLAVKLAKAANAREALNIISAPSLSKKSLRKIKETIDRFERCSKFVLPEHKTISLLAQKMEAAICEIQALADHRKEQ